jgi:hypothetical protein
VTDYLSCNLRLKQSINGVKKRERGGCDKNQNTGRNVGSDLFKIGVMRECSTNCGVILLSVEVDDTGKHSGDEDDDNDQEEH